MSDKKKTKDQLIRELTALRREITGLKASERLRSEQFYHSIVENVADVIYVLSTDGTINSLNPAFDNVTGLSRSEWIGMNFSQIIHPDDRAFALEQFQRVLQGETLSKFQLRTLSKSGDYMIAEFTAAPQLHEGTVVSVLGIARDITEHKEMEEKLRALSLTDELTGLYNLRGFFTFAEQLLKLANRQKKGIFMLYGDVDNLKVINDTLGHREGDSALIDTAALLKTTYRESDIIARIGGDEFVVVPVGIDGDNIGTIANRFLRNLEDHAAKNNRSYRLSVSIGISHYDPQNPCSVDQLIADADTMMYEQKRMRRNSWSTSLLHFR